MFPAKLPQGPLGHILSEGKQDPPSAGQASQQPGVTSTSQRTSSPFQIPVKNPIGDALSAGLKGLNDAAEGVQTSASQITEVVEQGIAAVGRGVPGPKDLKSQADAALASVAPLTSATPQVGLPSANAVQQPGDAPTAKKPASLLPIPLNNPIGSALNLESELKGLSGAAETVLSSAPQIPVAGLGDGAPLVKNGLDGLKAQADTVLAGGPRIPVAGLGDGAPLAKNGLEGLKSQADAALANAPKLPGLPGVGDGSTGIPSLGGLAGGLGAIPGPLGGLLSGFVPSSGVLADLAKIQAFVQSLYLIPGRIVAFLNKWAWVRDIPKLIRTFFSPSFDLRAAVIKFSGQGIKLTLVGVVLSSIAGWASFFLALVNTALFLSIAPVFWTFLFLLGFEVSFVELLRYTGKKKQS